MYQGCLGGGFGHCPFQIGSGAFLALATFPHEQCHLSRCLDTSTAMALEALKYGNFKPQQVFQEAKSLPGFGGDPTAWADYRFQVEAVQAREEKISDTERKKLGPLALRLVERLQGPALQVAKQLGVPVLVREDGTEKLMKALADELMPMRRQAALELYNAGTVPQGPLSRQQGESMSSYLLRREAWWNNLKELDSSLQVSETILGEQTLAQAGLQPMEVQMVRTVCKNDLNKKDLYRALRDQFGQVHEREKAGKGFHRSYGRGYGKGGWQTGGKSYGYMATNEEIDETYGGQEVAMLRMPEQIGKMKATRRRTPGAMTRLRRQS